WRCDAGTQPVKGYQEKGTHRRSLSLGGNEVRCDSAVAVVPIRTCDGDSCARRASNHPTCVEALEEAGPARVHAQTVPGVDCRRVVIRAVAADRASPLVRGVDRDRTG